MDERRTRGPGSERTRVEPGWRVPYELLMFVLMLVFFAGLIRDSERVMGAALGPYGLGQMTEGYLRYTNWRGLGAQRHPQSYRRWGMIYMLGGFAMVLVSFYLLRA